MLQKDLSRFDIFLQYNLAHIESHGSVWATLWTAENLVNFFGNLHYIVETLRRRSMLIGTNGCTYSPRRQDADGKRFPSFLVVRILFETEPILWRGERESIILLYRERESQLRSKWANLLRLLSIFVSRRERNSDHACCCRYFWVNFFGAEWNVNRDDFVQNFAPSSTRWMAGIWHWEREKI